MSRLTPYILVLLILSGCNFLQPKSRTPDENVLARVKDKYLYKKDITDAGLKFATAEDSLKIVSEYIDNWIRHQLMVLYAEENLPSDKLDIENQIEDYRESLIVYIYEKEYISQNLDTAITDLQRKEFYETNISIFTLAEDIFQIKYLKISSDSPKKDSIDIWLNNLEDEYRIRIEEYCEVYAIEYNLEDSIWINKSFLENNVSKYLVENFDLNKKKIIEFDESPFTYYFKIVNFKINETNAPFEYVRVGIDRMILNKRKFKMKQDFNVNIYKDAAKNNTFEIFN